MRIVGVCIPAPALPVDPMPSTWEAVCPGCQREITEFRQTGLRPHVTDLADPKALVCAMSGGKTR